MQTVSILFENWQNFPEEIANQLEGFWFDLDFSTLAWYK